MKFVLIIAGLLIGGAVASPAVKDNVNALTVQRIQSELLFWSSVLFFVEYF